PDLAGKYKNEEKKEEPPNPDTATIKIPDTTFHVKFRPYGKEEEPFQYAKIIPDSVGDFTAGYKISYANSNVVGGYAKPNELQNLLDNGEYQIIDKSEVPENYKKPKPEDKSQTSLTSVLSSMKKLNENPPDKVRLVEKPKTKEAEAKSADKEYPIKIITTI
ncbi:hypothetical protein MEO41_28085, partial [Dolichospermum sp. ST_sed4]|nr:hypothetical protein [Dolichospermum sp. ST_sed4]